MTEAVTPPPAGGAQGLMRRILAFAGIPFLSLLAPFLFLPALARVAGADAWVAIALGQSIGGFAALVAGLGYPTLAPPRVALAHALDRRRIVATSLHARVPVWIVAAIAAAFIAYLVAPASHRGEAVAMAIVMSAAALSPTWYWIGVGRALPILAAEVVPRMLASLAATVVLLSGGGAIWYPLLLAVAMIAGPAWVYVRIAGSELISVSRAEVAGVLRAHPPAIVAESAAGAYNALAVTLVAAVAPVMQAAAYVSGDKTYRIGQYAVSSLGNALQGWVAEGLREPALLVHRIRVAVILHAGLGTAGLLAFATLGPWLTRLLFGESVAIDLPTALGFGVATLGIALGTACGRIGLITLGARRTFMFCVLAASGLGVAGLLAGGTLWGAAGAAWGLGIAELASGVGQGLLLLGLLRRSSSSS
ncbi:polysaccharide biosynthesis protein [Salinibacterium sp. ZJ70]|uniref:polysaccharide biosynthesis protein n=1 Tax=Salinibacterium sp. ZJ70 TaxID=2708084 RepID=UPI0014227F88|nr:polysaccharide biosynthesis protein [Salinibacterium sp. ZJ70]